MTRIILAATLFGLISVAPTAAQVDVDELYDLVGHNSQNTADIPFVTNMLRSWLELQKDRE